MSILKIVIDTREQRPFSFPQEYCKVKRRKLDAGDYALEGDLFFSIERKTVDDFVGTVGCGWARFLREFERMDTMKFVAKTIIVEGSYKNFIEGEHRHEKMHASFIVKRISQLTLMGISVLFAENDIFASYMAYAILKERHNQLLMLNNS